VPFHSDQLHAAAVSEGEAIIANQDAWLCVERIFSVAGDTIEFVKAVMCWAIQYGLRKVDIIKEEVFCWLALSVIERHADVVFADASGVVSI